MSRKTWVFAALAACGLMSACTPAEKVDLVIDNARIVSGDGSLIDGSVVVVDDGKIVAIRKDASRLEATRRIDAAGKTVLPGYIDTHVHLLFQIPATTDDELKAWLDANMQARLDTYSAAGYTSVMSMGDFTPEILSIRERVATGELKGPHIHAVGLMFTAPGGHPAATVCRDNEFCRVKLTAEVGDAETARARVRELAGAGVDAIKVVYGQAGPFPLLQDDVLAALAAETKAQGLPLIAHTTATADMLKALDLGVTQFAHTPSQGAFTDDDLKRPDIAGLPVSTPTGLPAFANTNDAPRIDNMKRLKAAGAVIAFGTDLSQKPPTEALALQIDSLSGAFSPAEIIAALTHNAATFLGADKSVGDIARGYDADLVIVDGDPLADVNALKNVAVVINGGAVLVERAATP